MDEARAAIDEGLAAVADHPDIRFAGYLQDAQKEYAEARLTEVIVHGGSAVPTPDALGVEDAPYLNGMAEAIGEARRRVLDLLRAGAVDEGDAVLAAMEDLYAVLVTMDYPDAITGQPAAFDRRRAQPDREDPRATSRSRASQQDLHDALDRHAREVLGKGD